MYPVDVQEAGLGSASPTVFQCERSLDSMIWMFPPAEFVPYA